MRTYASMTSMLLQDHRFARVCCKMPNCMGVWNLWDMCFVEKLPTSTACFHRRGISLQGWLLGSYPPVETGSGLSLVTSLWEARQRRRHGIPASQALETRYFCEYDFSSKSWKFSAFQVELLYFETVIPSPLSIVGMDGLPNQLEQIFGIDHSKKISYTSDSDIHEHDCFVESSWFVLRRCVFSEPHVAGVGIPTHITHNEWELFVPNNPEVAPVFRCYGKGTANSWCLMNYADKFVAPVWGRWEHYENCRSHTVWDDAAYWCILFDSVWLCDPTTG